MSNCFRIVLPDRQVGFATHPCRFLEIAAFGLFQPSGMLPKNLSLYLTLDVENLFMDAIPGGRSRGFADVNRYPT